MQVSRTNLSDTKVQLTITADEAELSQVKNQSLRALAKGLRLPGFRAGKAPLPIVEKNVNPATLQQEVLDRVLNELYGKALDQEALRPADQPAVTVKKFVPFTTLEVEAEVDVIGAVKLADYKRLKLKKETVKVADKDIDEVLDQLRTREAEREDVERPAADGDQVTIDFEGTDTTTKEPVGGASGRQHPLVIGSNSFIPGFEPNLIGLAAGDSKQFTVTFPEDYGVSALQNREVSFAVTVHGVAAVKRPAVDDEFAAKVGPFKDVEELKADIRRQLQAERQYQADRTFDEKVLNEVADKSEVPIPDSLIERELARMEADERQNLGYRGQTWQEHLDAEGVTEAEHQARNREQAVRRVKAGLVLADIAEKENIEVGIDELDARINVLKGQYSDKAMQAELSKPENRRNIASRILTEKTLQKLIGYVTAAK